MTQNVKVCYHSNMRDFVIHLFFFNRQRGGSPTQISIDPVDPVVPVDPVGFTGIVPVDAAGNYPVDAAGIIPTVPDD